MKKNVRKSPVEKQPLRKGVNKRKVAAIIGIVAVVLNLLLYGFRVYDELPFWIVIGLAAILTLNLKHIPA